MAQLCYVGDSRTNGLKDAVSGPSFIAKDSSGYSWLKSSAYSQVKTWLKSNPTGIVVFNFGVNDLYNISNYINYYKNTVIQENPNKSIYFMTVNPVNGDPYATNSEIQQFNQKMASNFPNRIIDTYSNVSFTTVDGVHYNTTTYKAIHNYVQKVLQGGASKNSTSLRTKLIQIALAEVGTHETGINECKYNDWYYGSHVSGSAYPWCAVFVSWCANKAGMLDKFIPKTASCTTGMEWYSSKGWYKKRGSYTPQAGDVIYFGGGSHTGIVKSCDGSTVHTIEGNSSNQVIERSYGINDSYISGYGAYEGAGVAGDISGSDGTGSSNLTSLLPAVTYTEYTVKKGDTIESIAKKFHTTVSMIIYLNDLSISDLTNLVGKTLKVPENSNSETVGTIAASQVITKKSTRGVTITHPYANVSIFTETEMLSITQSLIVKDTTMDLDILSIATNRDMSQDCPTFSITLSFRRDWYEKIAPNDLIIIDMCRPPETKRTVFFGLVDDCRKSTDFNSDTPTRTIAVTGRGFGKAFSRFEIGVISELSAVNDTLGFMSNSLDALAQGSPSELTKSVIDFYIGKGCNYKFSNGKNYMDYYQQTITGRDDNYEQLADTTTFLSYQGTLNNFLKELRNAPFNESYWEIYNNRPTYIFRPTPFNETEWTDLFRIEIKDMDIVKESLGKSDVETYTVYKVNAETFLGTTDTIYFPLWYPPYYEKYGLSRLEVTSKYLTAGNLLDSSGGTTGSGVNSGSSELTGSENAEKIWNYFKGKGLTSYGIAGLMGNLEAESGLDPTNLQNSSNSRSGMSDSEFTSAVDSGKISKSEFIASSKFSGASSREYGYGLAQWTSKTRKQGLYELVKSRNVSIGDLATQLDWLYQELSSGYSDVLSTLKSATSLQQASNKVLIKFESPTDQSSSVQATRQQMGQKYYDKYAKNSGDNGPESRTTKKVKAKFTAYYPFNNAMEGGYYDALGNKLNPSHNTLAAPPSIPFHTKIKITGTGTSRDNGVYEVLDRGGAIQIEGDTYHFDILMSSASECNNWGVKYGYAIIGDTSGVDGETTGTTSGDGTVSGDSTYSSDYVVMENEKEATLARMIDLYNWNILNNAMENGTLIVKGSNQYRIGERIILESTGVEYYVEAVAHNFTFFQGWTTTLTLTRGIVPNLRYASPWGKYQEMTLEDASKIFGYDVGSCMVATSSDSSVTSGNANTSGWGSKGVSCPRYYQSGQSWSDIDYQGGSIGRRGCGLCCLAMAVSGLLKTDATPDKVVKLLNDAGVNTVYNARKCTEIVCNHYGLKWTTVSRTNKSAIDSYLKRGCVIYHSIDANGIYTGGGHFIMCVGTDGKGGYYVQESAHYYQTDKAYTFSQVFSPGVQGPFVIGKSL